MVSDIAPDMAHCVPREFCQDLRRCGGIERCIESCLNLLQRFHSSNLHQFHTHLHSPVQSNDVECVSIIPVPAPAPCLVSASIIHWMHSPLHCLDKILKIQEKKSTAMSKFL